VLSEEAAAAAAAAIAASTATAATTTQPSPPLDAAATAATAATTTAPDPKVPAHWEEQLRSAPWGRRRVLRRYIRAVAAVNALEPQVRALPDEALPDLTRSLRARVAASLSPSALGASAAADPDCDAYRSALRAALDACLPEAFAAAREAARRALGLRHFDAQLVGGMALHDGCVAEMATGEGKTLVAVLAAYLSALAPRPSGWSGVHVVTVNDYLAARDAAWMGRAYSLLGLRCAAVQGGMAPVEVRRAYEADVTYVTGQELCFNYLRDNTAASAEELVS
jgi:preprotein translocase subunit SecA